MGLECPKSVPTQQQVPCRAQLDADRARDCAEGHSMEEEDARRSEVTEP